MDNYSISCQNCHEVIGAGQEQHQVTLKGKGGYIYTLCKKCHKRLSASGDVVVEQQAMFDVPVSPWINRRRRNHARQA